MLEWYVLCCNVEVVGDVGGGEGEVEVVFVGEVGEDLVCGVE